MNDEIIIQAQEEYISSNSITLKAIGEKFGIPLDLLKEISRKEKWSSRRKNKANKTEDQNGGLTSVVDDTQNGDLKGVPPSPPESEGVREETEKLRELAFRLAMKAGETLEEKREHSSKDFELHIGVWTKIVGVQTKLDGDADGIEKLIGELSEGDDHPDSI